MDSWGKIATSRSSLKVVMAFISLTFLTILALSSLGFPQATANCGAYNSDIWKGDKESSEGSCSRPSLENVVEDTLEAKDSEEDKTEEVRTEVKESSFIDYIMKIIKFAMMIFKWFSNSNNK